MSEIGGIGNTGSNPFLQATQRQQGFDAVEQQRQIQDRVSAQAREALLLKIEDPNAAAERARDEIRQEAGPGVRRDALARTDGSPQFRRLSDETAAIEAAGQQRAEVEQVQRGVAPDRDEVRLSSEAQQRLAAESQTPPPGEAIVPETDDPLRIDTAQETQRLELSDPVDRGRNETQAGRALGQILDQFS